MAEYIKRKDVLALIDDFELTLPDDEIFFSYIPVKAVEELPAADVVERKHGKWLHTPTYWYYCSVCGREPPDETNITTKFCPNCGAEMGNEDEYIKV